MKAVDLLIDMIEFNADWVRRAVAEMPPEVLAWQTDPGGNNINVNLWHLSRMLDIFKTRFLEGKDQEAELWFAEGWDQKTEYDSRGIGMQGMGAVIGYSQAEVAAIPQFGKETLMAYYDAVHQAMIDYLRGLPEGGLQEMRKSFTLEQSVYAFSRHVFLDEVRHFGEILAIQAMWERQQESVEA